MLVGKMAEVEQRVDAVAAQSTAMMKTVVNMDAAVQLQFARIGEQYEQKIAAVQRDVAAGLQDLQRVAREVATGVARDAVQQARVGDGPAADVAQLRHETRVVREHQLAALPRQQSMRVLAGLHATDRVVVAELLGVPAADVVAVAPLGSRQGPAASRQYRVTFSSPEAAGRATAATLRIPGVSLYPYRTGWQATLWALMRRIKAVLATSPTYGGLSLVVQNDALWILDGTEVEKMFPVWGHMPADEGGAFRRVALADLEEVVRSVLARPPATQRARAGGRRPSRPASPVGDSPPGGVVAPQSSAGGAAGAAQRGGAAGPSGAAVGAPAARGGTR